MISDSSDEVDWQGSIMEENQSIIDILFFALSGFSIFCSLLILFLHTLLHQTTLSYANKLVFNMTLCSFLRNFAELLFLLIVREASQGKATVCFVGSLVIFGFRLAAIFWGAVISFCVYNSVVLENEVEGRHSTFLLLGCGIPLLLLAAPLIHEDVNDSTFCSLMGISRMEFPSGFLFTFFEYILFFWLCNLYSMYFYCRVLSFVRIYFKNSLEEKAVHQRMATKIMLFPGLNMLFGILTCAAIAHLYITSQDRFNMRVMLIVADHIEAPLSTYVYGVNDSVQEYIRRKFRWMCRLKRKRRPKDMIEAWNSDEKLLSDEYESHSGEGSQDDDPNNLKTKPLRTHNLLNTPHTTVFHISNNNL